MHNAQLVAVYGRNKSKSEVFAETHTCTPYNNLEKMLSDASIDIVTITTPSGAHLDPCALAAKAGKHIICEKPLEITTERIEQIIELCERENVILSGIYNRRFFPVVSTLKQAIEKQRFGTVSLVEAQLKWYRTQEYYDSAAWRGTKLLDGGGALMNQGIHTIDLLLHLMGPVERLTASIATRTHKRIEVEDTAVAILEFKNGARGVIQASTSCWSQDGHPAEIHICGDQGSVFMTDDRFRVWDFKVPFSEDNDIRAKYLLRGAEGGMGANDPMAMNYAGHKSNFENVIAALEGKESLLVTGQESMNAVKVINLMYRSAENEGEWLSVN